MILLESSIHNIKVKFNDRVHELRKRKVVIIENVDALYSRLAEINKELALPDETVKFFIDDKVENPAKMYTVDDEQIEAYREKLKKDAEEVANAKKGKGKNRKPADAEKEQKEAEEAKKKMEESKHAKEGPAVEMRDHMRQVAARPDTKVQENDLYSEIRMIKEEIDLTVNQVDGEIHEMQFEKFRLESDLKNAELKLILLYEELILLESLESRDQELTSKL
jgi:chromosome segregation ATPase